MKKTLLALGAIALLGFASCNPDDEKPPIGGTYNPPVKIATISDSYSSEQWVWEDNKVTRIDHYEDSQANGSTTFTYNENNQLTQVAPQGSGVVQFVYNGNKLAQVSMSHHDLPAPMTLDVQYKGNNISSLTMPISSEMVQQMLGELMGGFMDDMDSEATKAGQDSVSKMQIDLIWNGANVARVANTTHVVYNIPADRLVELASTVMPELAEQYGELIQTFLTMTNLQQVPLILDISDTLDFTYDQNKNPLQGFLGRFEDPYYSMAEILSKNNITQVTSHGATSYRLDLGSYASMVPTAFAQWLSNTTPHDAETDTFTYQYNDKGYPIETTSDDGYTQKITYLE